MPLHTNFLHSPHNKQLWELLLATAAGLGKVMDTQLSNAKTASMGPILATKLIAQKGSRLDPTR